MVIILKTFYIFKLNKEYYSIAKKDSLNVYIALKSIYSYKNKDILVPFNLFNEICSPINKDFFNKYIYDKLKILDEYTKFKNIHMYHNYFTNEESKVIINNSHIKIKSNNENNIFIKSISDISNLFICDFSDNYFMLNNSISCKQEKTLV